MRRTETEDYLGDGVYIDLNPDIGGIVLKANDNEFPSDTIYLDCQVLKALVNYLIKHEVK